MPRRIPAYPLAFWGWNYISSIGSAASLGAVVLFFFIVVGMAIRAPDR